MPDSQIAYSAGTETPLKFSPATTMGRLPSLAQEGLEAVEKIIPFLRMVSTESLLKKFTPDKDVATVLQTLKQNGTYGGGAWTKFPDPNSGKILERDLYEPFVETANEIASAFGRSTVNAVWINRANKTPESSIKGAAKIRPDCLSATSPELAELDSQIRELENELEALTRNTHAYVKAAKLAEISSKKNKLLQKLNLWWRQAQVPMEWKLEENEEPLQPSDPVVLQALSYMRWMLAEQLDRRFVLGLIVCYNQLTILFSDRSGTLMANSPINIHEKPLDFIRVIGGIRCMSPEQLGWDTRMLLYKNVDQTIVPSYNAGADYKGVYGDTHYHLHWVIDVTVNRKVEQFLTARIISSVRAQGMCGRATLVFEVIKYNERSNPRKTWILKRYWRPNNDPEDPAYPTEGQFYEILGHDAKDLRPKFDFTYHDITTSGGQVDNTFSTIRAGITSGLPHSKSIAPHGKLVQEDEPEAELSLHVKITDPSLAEPMVPHSRYEPVDRVHNQILLPTGIHIKHFCHIRELLRVFLHDHHRAHEKGVIHRDVSIGNLMIFLRNADDFKDTFGRLIDFDHAKRVSGTIALPRNDYPEQILESTQVQVRYSTNFEVTTDTAQKACDYVGMLSAAYLEDVTKFMVQFQSTQKEGALTPADLGWFDGVSQPV
ncbi:hypothetical protein H0H81_009386 [Sphagnurus paluster]|uniref:Fungal-type protein kinase domain-containing protein n=1 Tax=Sphagnurus paluster TaxID=117069 RepID=A0A9P7FS51_9AGAR|nr:hypothetical protein H0H81_009386 [Sphagnurus paluster]